MSEPIKQLVSNARIKGASRIIPDALSPDAVTDEQRQLVTQGVLDYIASRPGLNRTGVARSVGISTTVLGMFLNGGAGGFAGWRQLAIDLDLWLENQLRSDGKPRTTDFVWTSVAEEIRAVADVAQQLKTIGLAYGPESAGMGKTMALHAIAAAKPGSVVVTVRKIDATATGIIWAIANALHIGGLASRRSRWLFQRVTETLAGTNRLLMIDQIHSLCGHPGDKPLYVLADLFDATGAPQLWCGTSDIVTYLQRGQDAGRDSLAQIRRRIGCARDLLERTRGDDGGPGEPLYTIDEIRRVFGRGQMRLTPDAVRYLCQLANTPDSGALGAAANLVAMATAINQNNATALTADMLRTAHRMLVSRAKFMAVEERMIEPAQKVRAG